MIPGMAREIYVWEIREKNHQWVFTKKMVFGNNPLPNKAIFCVSEIGGAFKKPTVLPADVHL